MSTHVAEEIVATKDEPNKLYLMVMLIGSELGKFIGKPDKVRLEPIASEWE